MLKIKLPWIERLGIELGIELAGIKLTLDRADLDRASRHRDASSVERYCCGNFTAAMVVEGGQLRADVAEKGLITTHWNQ